jgi:hydrogenase expression/formation protein HypD
MKVDVVFRKCEKLQGLCSTLCRARPSVRVMEICGTHTMAVARGGLRDLLPKELKLTSGPGCPVCVTDQSYIDQAVLLARRRQVAIATYGDMVRVPGRAGSLADARAAGATVEVVYSADQAVELALRRPDRQVVFLAVGFETTAPGTAMALLRAKKHGIGNFSVLAAHKLIPPAMRALLSGQGADAGIDGFLCPGHVSVIIGYKAYGEIVRDFGRPCVVAGFDPGQILDGLTEVLAQLVSGQPKACSVYPAAGAKPNKEARKLVDEVLAVCDARWRGLGVIPASALALREEFAAFDAARRLELPEVDSYELPGCRCGEVVCGLCAPTDCRLFARECTPRDPVGPCMVSSEGACAADYKYQRRCENACCSAG